MPKNWKDFLRVEENKTELFTFLSQQAINTPIEKGKSLYATDEPNVLCSAVTDLFRIDPCSHEEADTRLYLHVADAFRSGSRQVLIRSVDTDVVIAVAVFKEIKAEEIFIAFGTGTNLRFIPIHEIVTSLNLRMCARLPFFRTFTGCDTVSLFAGRGKRTAWETWNIYLDVTLAFEELLQMPGQVSDNSMAQSSISWCSCIAEPVRTLRSMKQENNSSHKSLDP